MLTRELDYETEQLLVEILQRENVTSEELIRTLIHDRWHALHQPPIELKLPPLPEPTSRSLPAPASYVKPRNDKQMIADFIRKKRFH